MKPVKDFFSFFTIVAYCLLITVFIALLIWGIYEIGIKENEHTETPFGKHQNCDVENVRMDGCEYIVLYHHKTPVSLTHKENCDNHKINTK